MVHWALLKFRNFSVYTSIVFVYLIRFQPSPLQVGLLILYHSFTSLSMLLTDDILWMLLIIGFGALSSLDVSTNEMVLLYRSPDRKIQVATAVSASIYGLVFVLYLLVFSSWADLSIPWRFYGLGGLVTTPLLLVIWLETLA